MALSLEPGYLDFDNLPDTNFTCVGKVIGGYYADLEANCQMFHVCTIGQADEPMDIRFLCLNGTVFDQETRVCERIDEVDCSKSEQFYSLNLELYGNSGPILEESPEVAQETESPSIIIKSTTSTTTTTTTTTKRPSNRPATPPYYTTIRPHIITTAANKPKVVSTHHFPVNAPDIRFNPEEINISLNPGAPPDIRTKHFLHQSFSDISQDILNDNINSDGGHIIKVHKPERLHVSSSTSPKSIYAVDNSNNHKLPQTIENNFGFSDEEYQTDFPRQRQQQFLIQTNSFRHSQSFPPNIDHHNSNQYHHQHFHSTTAKQNNNFHQDPAHSTLRTIYLHSLKPPEIHQHHHYTHHHRTEKPPHRVQIPIPLLPTLPPLTFSSPAPFTLQRHIETKRYTKDHPAPPRIIISASASVSDASGRRLNYSLGTIGAAQILKAPPASYDDYKDSDVGLDPFYHDVPKLNQERRKRRSTEQKEEKINPFEIIKNEKEAVDVLKFLFTWYQSHQATATVPPATSPVTSDLIHKINYEFSPKDIDSTLLTDSSEYHSTSSKEFTSTESLRPEYENSELFKKNGRYSIVGGYRNLDSKPNLSDKTFKITASNVVGKHAEQTRAGKNLEVDDDLLTEIIRGMPEIKEKMDDSEVTIVKDLKEAYFNPYDYVDDNYEGEVYKENSPNITQEKEKNTVPAYPPKEEDIRIIRDGVQTKNYSANPTTVAELYKYFNVNHDWSTERTTIKKFIAEVTNNETKNTEYYKLENATNKNKEIIAPNESLGKNTSFVAETLQKFTEMNVISEVNKDHESSSITSTTSTTSTESPSSSRSGIRRGRGRQRQHSANYKERQRNVNNFSSLTELHEHELEPKVEEIYSIREPSNTTRSQNRRGRNRGRSRFVDYYNSTSTTTPTTTSTTTSTVAPRVDNLFVDENSEESHIGDIPFSTLPTIIESIESDPILQMLNTVPTLKAYNFDEVDSTSKSDVVEPNNIYKSNISEDTSESSQISEITEPIGTFESEHNSSKDIPSYDDIKYTDDLHEMSKHENKEGNLLKDLSSTENYILISDNYSNQKNIAIEKVRLDYETSSIVNGEHMQIEISTKPSIHENRDQFTISKEPNHTTKTVDDEIIKEEISTNSPINTNELPNHSSTTKDTQEFLSELQSEAETTKDESSYLIKLLRYFAESAMDEGEKSTTEIPAESYSPLTESQVTTTTTEKTYDPVYHQKRPINRGSQYKRGRQRNNHWHPPRVSTTGLPTLKDIYTFSDKSKSDENEIKHKNFKSAISLENLLDKIESETIISTTPANIDTTTTTKLILKIPDLELEEHIRTKSELLEQLTLIEQNLTENPNITAVTNTPIVDTTVTTPYISFEQSESFGTIPSVTDSTQPLAAGKEITKQLTQMFEISTESNVLPQLERIRNYKDFYSFYDDVFVVPELTEKNSYTVHDEENKTTEENTETTVLLESSSSTTSDQKIFSTLTEALDTLLSGTTQTSELNSTHVHKKTDQKEATTALVNKLEKYMIESTYNEDVPHDLDLSTLQPDVEIQKSISLPVSILESTFDISQDINDAHDINNLLPSLAFSEDPTTLRTTEKMQEYIQEIEESTKSIVAKDDQVKLGFTEGYGISATETLPTTLITTEATPINKETTVTSVEEHIKNPKYILVSEVQHNSTEILFVKDTESPKTSDRESTTILPTESPGMVNASHLLQVVIETTTPKAVTTILSTRRIPYQTRRTRPPKRRPYNNHKNQNGRHRFSTELFTNKPPIQSEARYKQNLFTATIISENITDAPLHRSATPTRSELKKVSLHTTPLSSQNSRLPSKLSKNYVFNCFGKDKHTYYADPRDCRLFHYCTQGYSKNQLLDLKFVCDQKTFFDDEKLLCTKVKPTRCL